MTGIGQTMTSNILKVNTKFQSLILIVECTTFCPFPRLVSIKSALIIQKLLVNGAFEFYDLQFGSLWTVLSKKYNVYYIYENIKVQLTDKQDKDHLKFARQRWLYFKCHGTSQKSLILTWNCHCHWIII